MFVQDIKFSGINITVDVPEKEAKNFQQMCRMFELDKSIEKAVDEYLLKVHQTRPARVIDLTIDTDSNNDEPPPAKRALLESLTTTTNTNSKATNSVDVSPNSDTIQTLTQVIMSNKAQIFQDIPVTSVEFVSRTVHRISDERDIVNLLKRHLNAHSIKLQTLPFGSATYGFGGAETDYNILVDISKKNHPKIPIFQISISIWEYFLNFSNF